MDEGENSMPLNVFDKGTVSSGLKCLTLKGHIHLDSSAALTIRRASSFI